MTMTLAEFQQDIRAGIPDTLPALQPYDTHVSHAPKRKDILTPEEKQALFENTARAMGDCKLFIKQRHVDNCSKADPAYGAGVAKAMGLEV